MHESLLDEILDERVTSSRGRRNPRGVKQKMSNYPIRDRSAPCNVRLDFGEHIVVVGVPRQSPEPKPEADLSSELAAEPAGCYLVLK